MNREILQGFDIAYNVICSVSVRHATKSAKNCQLQPTETGEELHVGRLQIANAVDSKKDSHHTQQKFTFLKSQKVNYVQHNNI